MDGGVTAAKRPAFLSLYTTRIKTPRQPWMIFDARWLPPAGFFVFSGDYAMPR